jgi:hypothetical protein
VSNNAQQVIIHPVPGGKFIIMRYGLIFRVLLDSPEGIIEFGQEWIQRNRTPLLKISSAASRMLRNCGLEVEVYG